MNVSLSKVGMIACLLLAGCSKVDITSPVNDAVYPNEAPDFVVSWAEEPTGTLNYQLNGNDVSAYFSVSESGSAQASAADLSPYLIDGKNTFSVTSANPVSFVYDQSGPIVHITSIEGDQLLSVSGYVEDPSGVASLNIDSVDIELDDSDQFSVELPAKNQYIFTAEDSAGHVSNSGYLAIGESVSPGIMAKITSSGFSGFESLINQAVTDLDLTAMLMAVNPIFDEGLLGTTATLNVTEAVSDTPVLGLDVPQGALNTLDLTISLPDFITYVGAEGTIAYLLPWQGAGNISADLAVFDISANISVVDSEFAVSINSIDADLNGFGFDIEGFPDVLEELIDFIIRPLIELLISNKLEDVIPEKIEQIVAGIVPGLSIVLNDTVIYVETNPTTFDTQNGSINLGLSNTAYLLGYQTDAASLGSIYVDSSQATISNTTPDGEEFDFAAGIGLNFFNQILLGSFNGGIFNIVSEELQADGSINKIEIVPVSAPYLSLMHSKSALGKLNLLDFQFRYSTKKPGQDDFELVFGATLNLKAPFDLSLTPDQKLAFELGVAPDIKVLSVDKEASLQLPEGFVQQVLDTTIPGILPSLTSGIEGFDLPVLTGSGLALNQVWADETLTFIVIAGEMQVSN